MDSYLTKVSAALSMALSSLMKNRELTEQQILSGLVVFTAATCRASDVTPAEAAFAFYRALEVVERAELVVMPMAEGVN